MSSNYDVLDLRALELCERELSEWKETVERQAFPHFNHFPDIMFDMLVNEVDLDFILAKYKVRVLLNTDTLSWMRAHEEELLA